MDNERNEWTSDDGYIDVGTDDGAADLWDGTVDTWVKDSTNKWHYRAA